MRPADVGQQGFYFTERLLSRHANPSLPPLPYLSFFRSAASAPSRQAAAGQVLWLSTAVVIVGTSAESCWKPLTDKIKDARQLRALLRGGTSCCFCFALDRLFFYHLTRASMTLTPAGEPGSWEEVRGFGGGERWAWVAAALRRTTLGDLFVNVGGVFLFFYPLSWYGEAWEAVICPVNAANLAPGDGRRPPRCLPGFCRQAGEKMIFY